jgi:hypothetical protein
MASLQIYLANGEQILSYGWIEAIALAGFALAAEEYGAPPSVCYAGYDFTENLAKYLSNILKINVSSARAKGNIR